MRCVIIVLPPVNLPTSDKIYLVTVINFPKEHSLHCALDAFSPLPAASVVAAPVGHVVVLPSSLEVASCWGWSWVGIPSPQAQGTHRAACWMGAGRPAAGDLEAPGLVLAESEGAWTAGLQAWLADHQAWAGHTGHWECSEELKWRIVLHYRTVNLPKTLTMDAPIYLPITRCNMLFKCSEFHEKRSCPPSNENILTINIRGNILGNFEVLKKSSEPRSDGPA